VKFKRCEVYFFALLGFFGDHFGFIGVVGLSLGVVGSAEETTMKGLVVKVLVDILLIV